MTVQQTLENVGPVADQGGSTAFGGTDGAGDYSYINGSEWLDLRSSITSNGGFPNAWAQTSGAVPWPPDEWVVVEVFLDATADRAMVWAAKYGADPVLTHDTTFSSNTLNANPVDQYDYIQLLNQSTNLQADPGRPNQNRWYDEVSVSTSPIKLLGDRTSLDRLGSHSQTGPELTEVS